MPYFSYGGCINLNDIDEKPKRYHDIFIEKKVQI